MNAQRKPRLVAVSRAAPERADGPTDHGCELETLIAAGAWEAAKAWLGASDRALREALRRHGVSAVGSAADPGDACLRVLERLDLRRETLCEQVNLLRCDRAECA